MVNVAATFAVFAVSMYDDLQQSDHLTIDSAIVMAFHSTGGH